MPTKQGLRQKLMGVAMTMSLGLTFFVAPATASASTDMLTLADSSQFTILGQVNDTESNIQVLGLDGTTYQTEPISDPQNIDWTTSDPSVVEFVNGSTTTDEITGTDTVGIKMLAEGRAYVTASCDGLEVSSYVVVERTGAPNESVSNITVTVDAPGTANDFTVTNQTVNLSDLSWLSDQSKTLQKDPSALHALAEAGDAEYHSSSWAANNLSVYSGGSYVAGIGTDFASGTEGWQYHIVRNGQTLPTPDYAASVFQLQAGDTVVWQYAAW